MAWFVRVTRFGQAHMCYAQEQSDSCGIACSIMVNFKLKAGSIGLGTLAHALFPSFGGITGKLLDRSAKSTAVLAEQEVYKSVGPHYSGTTGTTGDQVASILNRLHIGTWEGHNRFPTERIGAEILASYKQGWPTIIGNSWYKSAKHKSLAGGGHWVVVDTINEFGGTLYASICDPLTGNVHVTPFEVGKPFRYDPTNVVGWNVPIDDKRHYEDGYSSQGYSLMDGLVKCKVSNHRMIGTGGLFAK